MTNRNPYLTLAVFALLQGMTLRAIADDNSEWMSRVPDNMFVSQLSLPGSHDAGTGHGTSLDSFARTQDKTLTEQWNSGVRVFDLRPSVDNNRLQIYHGSVATELYLDDALSTLCGLLDSHPTELCIVIMRHEDDHDNGSSDWNGLMKKLLTSSPTSAHAVNFNPMVKMGDMRGKLLILCRNAYDTNPVGGFVTGWGFNANFDNQKGGIIRGVGTEGPLYIQDFYDVSASDAPATKTASIQRMLQFSCTENTNPNLWVVNHTSGYSKTLFSAATSDGYRDNAATQNPVVINYLSNHTGATGIVLMDFSGEDTSNGDTGGKVYNVKGQTLTNALIDNNFKESPFADYFRALTTIEANARYNVTTEVNGTKYYLTSDGYLNSDVAQAGIFTFSRVQGDAYYFGFQLKNAYFTNPPAGGNPTLNNGHIATDANSHRNNWEAQVFFLNTEGKFAVRATNAAGGTSGWAVNAETYWTVTPGTTPKAEYAKTPNYIWQLEEPNENIDVTYNIYFNQKKVAEVTVPSILNTKSALPDEMINDFCTYTYSPTIITRNSVRVTARWKGPFSFSSDFNNAHWYNLKIGRLGRYVCWENREPYHPHAFDEASAEVGKDPGNDRAVNIESELYATELVRASDAYQWAFLGDPYHIKVVNRQMGADYALTVDGDAVPAYNLYHGSQGMAPQTVLRTGEDYDYNWEIKKNTQNDNTDGFVLNLIGTNKYINPYGSADGFFQIWDNGNAKDDENTQLRVEEVPAAEITLNQLGYYYYSTLCLPYDATMDDETMAYTIENEGIHDGYAYLTPVEGKIAAGTPVVLISVNGPTATLTYDCSSFTTMPSTGNKLTGTFLPITNDNENIAYILGDCDGQLGFYRWTETSLDANRAYLSEASAAESQVADFVFIDLTTSIRETPFTLNPQRSTLNVTDLSGRQVNCISSHRQIPKGVYIMGGKKVIVK